MSDLKKHLDIFYNLGKKYPGPIRDCVTLNFGNTPKHIVIGSMIHGNEIGSLPAILTTIEKLLSKRLTYQGTISFFLGNVEAAQKGLRFIEKDLNRCFGNVGNQEHYHERQRALEIMKLMEQGDFFLDLHQTNLPSPFPFYIFAAHKESLTWARAIGGASHIVTRKYGASFSKAGQCSDEFFRSLGKPAVTVELSQNGLNEKSRIYGELIIERTIKVSNDYFYKNRNLEMLSKKNNKLVANMICYKEPMNDNYILKKGLENFQYISQGEVLGKSIDGEPLVCPEEGFILFPKYPTYKSNGEPIPQGNGELYLIVKSNRIKKLKKLGL